MRQIPLASDLKKADWANGVIRNLEAQVTKTKAAPFMDLPTPSGFAHFGYLRNSGRVRLLIRNGEESVVPASDLSLRNRVQLAELLEKL